MERLFLIVWKMRQDQEFQKSRVLVQSLMLMMGKEENEVAKRAYDDLRNAFFPYDRNEGVQETHELKKLIQKEHARGPLRVRAIEMPRRGKRIAFFDAPQEKVAAARRGKGVFS